MTRPWTFADHLKPGRPLPFVMAALFALLAQACADKEPSSQAPEAPRPRLPGPSNILLITIDTLRADHLSAYGYARQTSPVIDALAAEGVRFDQAAVQWPKTGPSFASIFTSTYPSDNGIVRKVGIEIPCQFPMLAEQLKRAGYSTHAVVANGALSKDFRFDQGFDTYIESWKAEVPAGVDPTGAEAVNRQVFKILETLDRSRPYFLWVHYLDPHFPYNPPEEWKDRFVDDVYFDPSRQIEVSKRRRQQMLGIGRSQVLEGREDLAFYVARYDEEIAYNDAKLGELLDKLEAEGLMERTLTALTSDHGESLGDHHYYFDHGRFGFQTCLRVPLILHYPGVLEPKVDSGPVELLDLTPTLLEAAGIELPDGTWMQGRSLGPRLLGEPAAEGELAFSEAGYATRGRWQRIVRDERFKLVHAQVLSERRWYSGKDVFFTLYDLENDPEETVNVVEEHPEVFERLLAQLEERREAEPWDVRVDVEGCAEGAGMTRETEDLLKSLGYLQGDT